MNHKNLKGKKIAKENKQRVEDGRRTLVDSVRSAGRRVYGLNTGYGAFHDKVISTKDLRALQRNLVLSHATGVGNPLSPEAVRATMTIMINSLSKGYSGVRISTIETLADMLNKGVIPVVPEMGSLGASGDLQPLAHIALVLTGNGEAFFKSKRMSGKEAMEQAGIGTIELDIKEGLSLINSTALMTAIGLLAVDDAERLLKTAQIVAAMSLEGIKGSLEPFSEKLHQVKPHKGQMICASNIRRLVEGSELVSSHQSGQDPYSFRCAPQVLGACIDAIEYIRAKVEIEANSVTDNPIVVPETGEILHGGNFHGESIAIPMDLLKIAVAEIGSISERRTANLLDTALKRGLPAYLTGGKPGLNSGLMMCQYTAASLVSENKVLAHPATVDSIPTSGLQEDHVSMGTISARQATTILRNVEYIVAIEFLCASQALDFRKSSRFGLGTQAAYKFLRNQVSHLGNDRVLYPDIEKAVQLVRSGNLIRCVENIIGKLK